MPEARHFASASIQPGDASTVRDFGVLLTQADFDALVRELESLRGQQRSELAGRGTCDRVELTRYAIRHGLVEP